MALEDFSKYTKIAVNPALPKNEKDLICALLAGRLRNLFNGRLFCLDLAISDLVKDASGFGLDNLKQGLLDLKGGLNDFKGAVGYDDILKSVNSALGGIGTVFSLGGLCPSPIRPPQIPDIMPMVNAQLFGQGMNILNALGKVTNPKMCFGGGPGGFGVNYDSMPGALRQLKNALNRAANDPAGLKTISNQFENNLKMQERRLKGELNRLKTNLSDPFGIKLAKQRADILKAVHSKGADYKVVDNKGIQHPNAIKSLVPSDTLALLNVNDNTPILYKRQAVLNYCGDEVGIKFAPVSGNIDYAGWDTNPATDNSDRPFGLHQLPVPDNSFYDFVITDSSGTVVASKYNTDTKQLDLVNSIDIERGLAYRFKINLSNTRMSVMNNTNAWSDGIEFGFQGPAGYEVIEISTGLKQGELDWSVLIENPTTPNNLTLSFDNGTTIPVNVSGKTSIPASERSYNLSDIVNKAVLFMHEQATTDTSTLKKKWNRIYTLNLHTIGGTGQHADKNLDIRYNPKKDNSYAYIKDADSSDPTDKILKTKTTLGNSTYSHNLYVNELTGVSLTKIVLQFGTKYSSLVFDAPVVITTDTKLPYKVQYSYRQFLTTPNVYNDEMEFILLDNTTIRFYLTSQRPDSYTNGRYMEYYDIDITDLANPVLKSSYSKFIQGSASYESTMTFKEEFTEVPLSARVSIPNLSVQEGSSVNSMPVTPAGGLDPYSFTVSPDLPSGLTLNSETGYITGTAPAAKASTPYVISVMDALEEDTVVLTFNLTVTAKPKVAPPMAGSGFVAGPGGGGSNILGDPDPNLFVQQSNGSWMPRVGAVSGKDYTYTEFTPGIYTLVNLNSYQPTAVENQPIAEGNGVARTWNINGTTFQTSQQYTIEQTNPTLNAYNQLPTDQKLQLINEYSAGKNFTGMTNAGPDYINSYDSPVFKDFLKSKGLGS